MKNLRHSILSTAIFGAFALCATPAFAQSNAADKPAASQSASMPKGQMATIDGQQIHYIVQGQGTPMVLIHGYPLNGGLFKNQVQALSQQHKLVLIDLPGFGQSKAADADASLKEYAQTVFGLMDHLKIEQAVIGGHSMGGMTTVEMYKQQPERFAGMILIDTTAKPAPIANAEWWHGFGEQAQEKGVASIAPILTPQMLTGEARTTQPELVKYTEGLVKAASVQGAVGGGKALAERPDNTEVLETVKVPALILVGLADSLTPVSMSKAMHESIKGSKLVVIDGASHASVLEEPQRANEAILAWAGQVAPAMAQSGSGKPASPQAGNGSASQLFSVLDDDGNGALDKAEVKDSADIDRDWMRLDENTDGRISSQEFSNQYTVEPGR